MRRFLFILILVILAALLVFFFRGELVRLIFQPTDSQTSVGRSEDDVSTENVEIIAEDLSVPWDVAFLPGGKIFVTERPGSLVLIEGGEIVSRIQVPGVNARGEGGLLGIALHPNFEENSFVYLYLTADSEDGTINRVERFTFGSSPLSLSDSQVIISDIPGASFHDGGRIAFGPDDLLYITTGDARTPDNAQNIDSLAGKILRLEPDGDIPEDNPFGNAVYSLGHRNPQGITWDDSGRLWSTEHGRSGLSSGFDELNLIERGVNYGWPVIQGGESREGMRTPVAHSGSGETWAPASAVFFGGSIFWGGLRGEALYEARIDGSDTVGLERHFFGEYGRIRAVSLGPDGFLYITTSNTDGRGEVRSGDDKLIKIDPQIFEDDDSGGI